MRSMEWIQLIGVILHGNIHLWLVAINAQRFTYFQILCYALEPGQIDVRQEFITIQNFGHNWWWANGIRVEYFPRIHHIAALLQSPRVHVKIEHTTRRFHRTDYLHVDVQRHLMGIKRQQERMRFKCLTRFSICKKIRSRTMVISRSWFREKVVFYQWG